MSTLFKIIIALFIFIGSSIYQIDIVCARPKSMGELAEYMKYLMPVPMPGPITSLYRPNFESQNEANLKFSNSEPVFIVVLPDGPRIYPQQYMLWHQVVNEVIDDEAYAVTYCPITGTLMAYNATIQGVNLIFDVEGHDTQDGFYSFLFEGNSVLIDRNTGSLWLQETGIAFDGQLAGHGLATLPVFWTSWEAAKRVYPNAPVLAKPKGRRPYGRDPYGSYLRPDNYYDNDVLLYAPRRLDKRFHKKAPMYCLEVENYLLAIEISYVKKEGAVNFFAGNYPLLAVYDPELEVVRVFNRQIWSEPFLFIMDDRKLIDLTTKSVWDRSTGKAVEGNMKGSSMKELFGVYSMWFAWASLNPETLAVPGPGEVPKELLSPNPPGIDENGNFIDPPKIEPGKIQLPGTEKWNP